MQLKFFVFIDDKKEIPLKKETIPANMYLCIYCDDFTKEKEYAHRLFDEIESKNYNNSRGLSMRKFE